MVCASVRVWSLPRSIQSTVDTIHTRRSTVVTIHTRKRLVDIDRQCDSRHEQIDQRSISTVELTQTPKNSHGHGWHWPGHPYFITHTGRSKWLTWTLTSVHRDLLQALFTKQDTRKKETHNNRDNVKHIVKSVWRRSWWYKNCSANIRVFYSPQVCVCAWRWWEIFLDTHPPRSHGPISDEKWSQHTSKYRRISTDLSTGRCVTDDIDIDRRSTYGRIRSISQPSIHLRSISTSTVDPPTGKYDRSLIVGEIWRYFCGRFDRRELWSPFTWRQLCRAFSS